MSPRRVPLYKGHGTPGGFGRGGFFSTYFWGDPARGLSGILLTQIYPNAHPSIREQFRKSVYEAMKFVLLTE